MKEKETAINIVYLAWLPYGIGHFHHFIESYLRFPAGHKHTLVIAFNGKAETATGIPEDYQNFLQQKKILHTKFLHFETGQDIVIYKQVVAQTNADHYLFLNSFSRVMAADWLLHYVNNWKENIGLIGASGSYANYYTASITQLKAILNSDTSLRRKFDELKYFLKLLFFYKNKFSKFPSPHIRTNGFFTSKKIFTSLTGDLISNKMEAYYFENGKNSLSVQVQKSGYDYILIDRNGKSYSINEWPGSNIFWKGKQENLLISDNQTRKYDEASAEEKILLKRIAWREK